MSTKEKQSFALYFLLAFGLAWLCQVYGSLLLLRDGNAAVYRGLLSVSMFCPLDRKSTRLNSSHWNKSRMPSSA